MQTEELNHLTEKYLPAIEDELQSAVSRVNDSGFGQFHHMMAYHMGWEGAGAGATARGKRIRPLVVLLTTEAAGGNCQLALPAAAAVELIHNFSLLHDDIEDNSPLRRGRPAAWVNWGVPQAINTGDAMFSLAHITLLRLETIASPEITLNATKILQNTCLQLTQGQFLDISYEDRKDLTLEDYWPMILGKTAALLSACTELGALIAGADEETQRNYKNFGTHLGLAFQALDDLLGIWGDSTKIGKSNASDLVEGKKSLPVLFGLEKKGAFANRWGEGKITPDEISEVADQLEAEGARVFTREIADQYTKKALDSLKSAHPTGKAGTALTQLANKLLSREI